MTKQPTPTAMKMMSNIDGLSVFKRRVLARAGIGNRDETGRRRIGIPYMLNRRPIPARQSKPQAPKLRTTARAMARWMASSKPISLTTSPALGDGCESSIGGANGLSRNGGNGLMTQPELIRAA